MTHDQAAADREMIAGEMKAKGYDWGPTAFNELGNAVRAFEVLCEPYQWERQVNRTGPAWWVAIGRGQFLMIEATGSHAADVCRLVCEVLDREAK